MKLRTMTLFAAASFVLAVAGVCRADDAAAPSGNANSKDSRKAMIEMHEKMATLHAKAVDCLKSDQSVDDCREQLKKNMPKCEGDDCPMSHMMGHDGMQGAHEKCPHEKCPMTHSACKSCKECKACKDGNCPECKEGKCAKCKDGKCPKCKDAKCKHCDGAKKAEKDEG